MGALLRMQKDPIFGDVQVTKGLMWKETSWMEFLVRRCSHSDSRDRSLAQGVTEYRENPVSSAILLSTASFSLPEIRKLVSTLTLCRLIAHGRISK